MPFTGVEYTEVCTWGPVAAAATSTHVVAINGTGSTPAGSTIPASSFAVFNLSTGSALLYGGANATLNAAVAYGGKVYCSDGPLYEITPSTGAVATRATSAGSDGVVVANNRIVSISSFSTVTITIYNPATSALVQQFGLSGSQRGYAAAPNGELLLTAIPSGGSVIRRYDVTGTSSSPNLLGTVTVPGLNYGVGPGAVIGDWVYWSSLSGGNRSSLYLAYNWVTQTAEIRSPTPAGSPGRESHLYAGADGNLYALTVETPVRLFVLNPNTGSWRADTLPTARGRRFTLAPTATKMFVPSGEPLG